MKRLPILFVEVGALLGISTTVTTLSDNDIETILGIIAQALVILYAIIKLLKEKPVNIKAVIAKLYELLTLILKVFKIIGIKKIFKARPKKAKTQKIDEDDSEDQ